MRMVKRRICNAGEPDNVLELEYDRAGRLVRAHAHAQFRDGPLNAVLERTAAGWYVRVDDWEHYCQRLVDAWACLPALLTEPDFWDEDTHVGV